MYYCDFWYVIFCPDCRAPGVRPGDPAGPLDELLSLLLRYYYYYYDYLLLTILIYYYYDLLLCRNIVNSIS